MIRHLRRPRRASYATTAVLLAMLATGCSNGSGGGTPQAAPPPPPPGPTTPGSGGSGSASVLAPIPVPGTTYYVDADTGDDQFDGLSPGTALRTLGTAALMLDKDGGDRLFLRGTFQETLLLADLNFIDGADPALPTVVQCAFDASGQPAQASIDGGISGAASFPFDQRGLPPGFGPGEGNYLGRGITILNGNYLTISGLQVRGIAGAAVWSQNASHMRLEHLAIEWLSESAILVSNAAPGEALADDLTIAYCRINQTNLGKWQDEGTRTGFNLRPETISIVAFDGFEVFENHLSNSMMEGIDFKLGSKNGTIRNNIVENTRSAGIYANEGLDTAIYRNIIRNIGYYDPEDGSGIQLAAPYLSQKVGAPVQAAGATGILMSNGDLSPTETFETGRCSGISVYENVVSWTLKGAFSVWNEWRSEGKTGWVLDDIHIFHNVAYRNAQENRIGGSAIQVDMGVTNSTVANNIVSDSLQQGLRVYDTTALGPFMASNVISHNLFWGNHSNGIEGTSPRTGDPAFVLPQAAPGSASDFQLTPGSPAVDAGLSIGLGPVAGTGPDIGAYELTLPPWNAGGAGN